MVTKKSDEPNSVKRNTKDETSVYCTGSQTASGCIRHLGENGIMVTHRGMSRRFIMPLGFFILNNLKFVSF